MDNNVSESISHDIFKLLNSMNNDHQNAQLVLTSVIPLCILLYDQTSSRTIC